jgi:uncharacterized protein (TIGR03663 family)
MAQTPTTPLEGTLAQTAPPRRRAALVIACLAVVAAAAALRLPQLHLRPMHTDEAVHAFKFQPLLEYGRYTYHAHDFHGPTLNVLTLPVAWATAGGWAGLAESHYRLVTALAGVCLAAASCLLAPGRRWGGAAAALAVAISPGMVFYSRYYIQEMLLVLFAAVGFLCARRHVRRPGWASAAALGAALGLMLATKETCVLMWAAMLLAAGLALAWSRLAGVSLGVLPALKPRWLLTAGAACVVVAAGLYSSGFREWQGPLEALRAFGGYGAKAAGGAHEHPWHYYLHVAALWRLGDGPAWSEAAVLVLALAGAAACLFNRAARGRSAAWGVFLTGYALALGAAYSIIPYKTPWCFLGVMHPLMLLAGTGAVAIWRAAKPPALKAALWLLGAVAAGHLAWQAYAASFVYYADTRNPYVYSQTSPSCLSLAAAVRQAVQAGGPGTQAMVLAQGHDYWPLPWYLRDLPHVGYADHPPARLDVPVIVADQALSPGVQAAIARTYCEQGALLLRPGVLMRLYVTPAIDEACRAPVAPRGTAP